MMQENDLKKIEHQKKKQKFCFEQKERERDELEHIYLESESSDWKSEKQNEWNGWMTQRRGRRRNVINFWRNFDSVILHFLSSLLSLKEILFFLLLKSSFHHLFFLFPSLKRREKRGKRETKSYIHY